MKILKELNIVSAEEYIEAAELANSATCRIHRPSDVRQHVAIFIEQYAVEKGAEATVKAESLRILAEAVYAATQVIYKMNDELLARSLNLQLELNELKRKHLPDDIYEQARWDARQEVKQELHEALAEVERVKATHMPNEIYAKRMRETSKLKEQRTEAQTQVFLLKEENEELKRRIQELTK